MFHSAGPILITLLLPLVLSTPIPIAQPQAQDASDLPFIPLLPLAARDNHDAPHSLWVHRSKLDQMDRRIIQSHRFRDSDGPGKRVGAVTRGRSASLGGSEHSVHFRHSPRANLDGIDHRTERDHPLVQRQEQTLGDFVDLGSAQLANAKVLFATTITQGQPGAQATGVSGEGQGSMMVEVIPSSSEMQTSAGTITESCLTMVSDSSQRFCETLLDGQVIGSDTGIAQVPPGASGEISSTSPAVTGTTSGHDTAAAAIVTDSASSSPTDTAGGGASASVSIGAIVNAAAPTVDSSTPTDSVLVSSPSSSGSDAQITGSPVVVNDSGPSPDSSSSSGPSAVISGSPIVVNDPVAPSGAVSPSAIILNAPTSSIVASSGSLITAPRSTAPPVVVNAPPTTSSAAASAAQENAAAAATIPGQKMQVLPIGLGIFGGLAGITLLVVGYVYWERRKYKRQFRTRKAAEKTLMDLAAPMGSGGYGAA